MQCNPVNLTFGTAFQISVGGFSPSLSNNFLRTNCLKPFKLKESWNSLSLLVQGQCFKNFDPNSGPVECHELLQTHNFVLK